MAKSRRLRKQGLLGGEPEEKAPESVEEKAPEPVVEEKAPGTPKNKVIVEEKTTSGVVKTKE